MNRSNYIFNFSLILIFLSLSCIGIVNHEMWRDELQAWLIAKDSSSISNLFSNLRYEGHPALWHLGLYVISRFTNNPISMQFYHLIFATGTIVLFVCFSPFTKLQKVLFTFGYFPFFEYSLISRSYAIGIFLIFLLCTLFKTRNQKYLWISIILFLLANVSIYTSIISIAIYCALLIEWIFMPSLKAVTLKTLARKRDLIISNVIFVAGILVSLWQIIPPADTGFAAKWETTIDAGYFMDCFSIISKAFLPIPNFFDLNWWNTNIFDLFPYKIEVSINFLLSLFLLSGILFFLLIDFQVFSIYVISIGLILIFTYIKYQGSLRHHGHIFILFIACLWIALYKDKRIDFPKIFFLKRISKFFYRKRNLLLNILLSIHAIAGIHAFSQDLLYSFSGSKEVSQVLNNFPANNVQIIGNQDAAVSPISGYLNKKIYYVENQKLGSFIVWNQERTDKKIELNKIIDFIGKIQSKNRSDIVLVLNYPLERKQISAFPQNITPINFSSNKIIVEDEKYYLYLIK